MLSPKEHLAYLLELAAEPGASERRELLRELGDLLTNWPEDHPVEARSPFVALLGRVERDVDPESRRELALKLADVSDAPLRLLNEFFFDLPEGARGAIVERNAATGAASDPLPVDEMSLIVAARNKRGAEFAQALADALGLDELTAMEVLQDASGFGLAIAARGAGVSRAAYSALAVLTARGDAAARLEAFDAVPERGAGALLAFWRQQAIAHAHPQAA